MNTKTCSKCGKEKPLEQFYRSASSKDGRRPNCKECSYIPAKHKTAEEKFWQHINKNCDNGCWEWTAGLNTKNGYGRIKDGSRHIQTHRLSWEIHFGKIPDGLFVCHKCDNPKCVNPSHLFLGTNKDNALDMVSKGRNNPRLGLDCSTTKLTPAQVLEIRAAYSIGEYSQRELARMYGVHQPCIKDIINRKTWRWLQ